MSKQERDNVREQIKNLEREQQKKWGQYQEDQRYNAGRYTQKLEESNRSFDSASRLARDAAVDHVSAISRLKEQEEERDRAKRATHAENVKQAQMKAAEDLEAIQTASERGQRNIMEHQSNEKKREEEARRQLNQEITERIKMEKEETERVNQDAQKQEKDQIEYKFNMEKSNLRDVEEMKKALLELTKEENNRQIEHQKTMSNLNSISVVSRMNMETAEIEMNKNRQAYDAIEDVTDEMNTLVRKFQEVSATLKITTRMRKVAALRKQTVNLTRGLESVKAKATTCLRQIEELSKQQIDTKDEERQIIFHLVMDDLGKLTEFHAGIQMLLPEDYDTDESVDWDGIQAIVEETAFSVDSAKTNWRQVPSVDRTNLVHAQLMATTNMLLKGIPLEDSKFMKLQGPEN